MTRSVTNRIGSLLTNEAARKAVDGVIHKVGRPLVQGTMETAEFGAEPATLIQSHLKAPDLAWISVHLTGATQEPLDRPF